MGAVVSIASVNITWSRVVTYRANESTSALYTKRISTSFSQTGSTSTETALFYYKWSYKRTKQGSTGLWKDLITKTQYYMEGQTSIIWDLHSLLKEGGIDTTNEYDIDLQCSVTSSSSQFSISTGQVSPTYKIASNIVNSITVFDNFTNTNLVINESTFGNKLRVQFPEDGSMDMTKTKINAIYNNKTVSLAVDDHARTAVGGKLYHHYDLIINGGVPLTPGGQNITVNFILTDGYLTKNFTITRKAIPIPSLGTFTLSTPTINMYNQPSTITLNCPTSPCKFTNTSPDSTGTYHIKTMAILISNSNTNWSINKPSTDPSHCRSVTYNDITTSSEGGQLIVPITTSNFVQFGDWGKSSYNGTSIGYVGVAFTNLYDQVFYSNIPKYTLNYNRASTISEPTLKVSISANGTFIELGSQPLHEQMYVRATCPYTAYTQDTLTAHLCYKVGSDDIEHIIATQSKSINNSTSPQSSSFTLTASSKIGEISSTTNYIWYVKVTSTYTGTVISSNVSTPVQQHIAPVILLSKIEKRDDKYDYFTYKFSSLGYNNLSQNYSYTYLLKSDEAVFVTGDVAQSSTNFSGNITNKTNKKDDNEWTSKTGHLEIVTTVNVTITKGITSHTFTSTKTTDSNEIIGYSDTPTPTISYRKNQLGINTDTVQSNAAIDVRLANKKDIILLGYVEGGEAIEISLSKNYIDIV